MLTISHPFDLSSIAKCRTEFVGYGGIKMVTNQVSFGVVEVEAVLNGTARPVQVIATQDGRGYVSEWHHAEESAGQVYFEVYSDRGRESHGWIDAESRRIVQTG